MQPVSGQAKMWALACPNQNLWHLWGLILELEFRIHLILGGGRSFSPIKLFLFPVAQPVKNLQWGRPGFDLWVWKTPWRRAWQPTPVFFPGESHGRRSLVCCSPWDRKESDMTEWLNSSWKHWTRWFSGFFWYKSPTIHWYVFLKNNQKNYFSNIHKSYVLQQLDQYM